MSEFGSMRSTASERDVMRRRSFVASLVATACAAPIRPAFAQTSPVPPVVGYVRLGATEADVANLNAFREGLRERGYVEGRTIAIDSRSAGGDLKVGVSLIEELARRPVAAFLAPGPAAARLIRQTTDIPIVAIGLPPGGEGDLFATLARPGGTVTGFSSFGEELSAKRIEVLRELLPRLSSLGILHNVADPVFSSWGAQTESSAAGQGLRTVRLKLQSNKVGEASELLRSGRVQGMEAVVVIRDFLTVTVRDEIVRTAAELGVPVIAEELAFIQAGALMSYGPDILDLFRRAAGYVDRIITGAHPGDLPIQLPTKFELALNARTARMLGVSIPSSLLARADEVVD